MTPIRTLAVLALVLVLAPALAAQQGTPQPEPAAPAAEPEPQAALPEPGPPVADPAAHAEAFLAAQTTEGWQESVTTLLGGSMVSAGDPEAVDKVSERLGQLRDVLGEPLGWELVMDETFGESLNRRVYMLLFERQPVVIELYYYRTDGWRLLTLDIQPGFRILATSARR